MGRKDPSPDLLPGTLDLLILRSLARGPMHGYGVAARLRQVSDDVLRVGESSLYPARQNNRRARFYSLTGVVQRQLARERREFERMAGAIVKVLETA